MSSILIIGIGNEQRGDDAAGLLAARMLCERSLPGVDIIEQSGDGVSLMQAWSGAQVVLLIDAAAAGGPPGAIYRIDANRDSVPLAALKSSSHLFGAGEAVEMARVLGELPPRLIIYGIEAADFTMGAGLSPPVAAQLPALAKQIADDILNMANDRPSS